MKTLTANPGIRFLNVWGIRVTPRPMRPTRTQATHPQTGEALDVPTYQRRGLTITRRPE